MMTQKSTQKRMKIKAVWVRSDNQHLMDVKRRATMVPYKNQIIIIYT
jgi:hypothetical protein